MGADNNRNNEENKKKTASNRDAKIDAIQVKSVIPKHRQEVLKWNGWGYKDSNFSVNLDAHEVRLTGNRYPIAGQNLPHLENWVRGTFDVDLVNPCESQPEPPEDAYPESRADPQILAEIAALGVDYSTRGIDRLFRAHGQTLKDIYTLRTGMFARIPDAVAWPRCHADVVAVVRLADARNLVVLPFGGGTAVSGASECPADETRAIVALDTSQMNRILSVDAENLVACCESGIIGQDLERELRKLGYTSGHEPDSYEFSSLGGWVATRASGMKKNVYGNIEDLLVHARVVTPRGVLEKSCQVPRLSCGPDFHHVVMGSEGTLGVVTEVTIKIRPLPRARRYGSVVFPDFDAGVACMREIARRRRQPASIRLMDNEQFRLGLILKPAAGAWRAWLDQLKKFYLTKVKRFDFDAICVMTLLFEADAEADVKDQERVVYDVAGTYGGLPAGEANGERGYMLTFVIAYIRDLALQYRIVAESFETSVPWDRARALCLNVKRRVRDECARLGAKSFVSCRVTQTYDAGCVVYFYFAFEYSRVATSPVDVYHAIEERARDEIVANGGSVSHHHGVGKLRQRWYPAAVSALGVDLYRSIKRELDPNNVFANGNLVPRAKL